MMSHLRTSRDEESGERRDRQALLRLGAEDLPSVGDASQLMGSVVLKPEPGACDEVFNGARDEYLVTAGKCHHTSSDMGPSLEPVERHTYGV